MAGLGKLFRVFGQLILELKARKFDCLGLLMTNSVNEFLGSIDRRIHILVGEPLG
jgi:hypothetical protein